MRRIVAILLALAPLLYAVGALFYGWLAFAMQCDEICDPDSGDWRYTRGAWQWYVIGGLGVAAFAAGILFFGSVVSHRPWLALAWLGMGAAAVVIALVALPVNPGSDRDLDIEWTFILVSAAVLLSGLIAAQLGDRGRGLTAGA
jgi:uncharacterized membrane protein